MHTLKGSALITLKRYITSELSESEAVIFLDNVKDIFPKQIISSRLYSLEHTIETERKFALFTNKTFESVVIEATRFVLMSDLNGIYISIIKWGGIERILGFSVYIAKSYYSYSQIKILKNYLGYFKYEVTIQEHLLEWCIYAYKGAYIGILEICGYKNASFNLLNTMHHTIKHGNDSLKYSTYSMEVHYDK